MKKRASAIVSKTLAIIVGTVTLLSAIVNLDLRRRRLSHDKAVAQRMMELEHAKFELEKERLRFEREKLSTRQTTLATSARQRAEHEVLRISKKATFTHSDASDFVQGLWEEFLGVEATEDYRQ